jgi:hypothetical protein
LSNNHSWAPDYRVALCPDWLSAPLVSTHLSTTPFRRKTPPSADILRKSSWTDEQPAWRPSVLSKLLLLLTGKRQIKPQPLPSVLFPIYHPCRPTLSATNPEQLQASLHKDVFVISQRIVQHPSNTPDLTLRLPN